MRIDVQVAVIDPGFDTVDDLELHCFHALDQGSEACVAVTISTCDIGGIAMHLRTGVDQEGPHVCGCFSIEIRVMQDRPVLV